MDTTRRDLCLSLPALALLGKSFASAQTHDTALLAGGTEELKHNHIFPASLPIKKTDVGSSQRVTQGALPTGDGVELHNSVLLPGHEPHPPHQHPHAEFLFIREGNVDWLVNGKRTAAGAGDILYAAPNELHGLRNIGTTPARYFVMAVGPNLKS